MDTSEMRLFRNTFLNCLKGEMSGTRTICLIRVRTKASRSFTDDDGEPYPASLKLLSMFLEMIFCTESISVCTVWCWVSRRFDSSSSILSRS